MVSTVIADFLPSIVLLAMSGLTIFIIGLGSVYMFGRMLDFLKTSRQKNTVGIITMIAASYWMVILYDMTDNTLRLGDVVFQATLYFVVAVIFYVLIGFDLYDRFNAWCDKRFGSKDQPSKKPQAPKRSRKPQASKKD